MASSSRQMTHTATEVAQAEVALIEPRPRPRVWAAPPRWDLLEAAPKPKDAANKPRSSTMRRAIRRASSWLYERCRRRYSVFDGVIVVTNYEDVFSNDRASDAFSRHLDAFRQPHIWIPTGLAVEAHRPDGTKIVLSERLGLVPDIRPTTPSEGEEPEQS